jgi:hypothetical protein
MAEMAVQKAVLFCPVPTFATAVESIGAKGYVSVIFMFPVPLPEPMGAQIWDMPKFVCAPLPVPQLTLNFGDGKLADPLNPE